MRLTTVNPSIYLIPNFHYDLTWHKDVATFMRISSQIFAEALDLLDRDPAFRFTVDHTAFLQMHLQARPRDLERIREHVRSGRLELVGGMVTMMDCDMPDGEAFSRQLLYGQRWLERTLGRRAEVGWFLDIYGFTPQLPQLLKLGGLDKLELCLWWAPEYMARQMKHSEFVWQGLDGSDILTHIAMPNYNGPRLPGARSYDEPPAPFDPARERELAEAAFAGYLPLVAQWAAGGEMLWHIGGDFRHPTPALSRFVAWWNESAEHPRMTLATPGDFFRAIEGRAAELPRYEGEISPAIHSEAKALARIRELQREHVRKERDGRFGEGYGEGKIERKQLDRLFSHRARAAEKVASIAALEGRHSSQAEVAALYHPVQVFEHHDPYIGCCVVEDYERMVAALRQSVAGAEALADDSLRYLGGLVDSRGEGRPVLVANSLSWSRRDVVSVKLFYEPGEARGLAVWSAGGDQVPSQIVARADHEDGSIREVEVLFLAEVPSLGHQLYFVRPAEPQAAASGAAEPVLDNRRYRLALSPAGSIGSLHEASTGRDLLGPAGAELVLEEDMGCFCYIDTTGRGWHQSDYPLARVQVVEQGPLRWRAFAENECKGLHYRLEASTYEHLPRVDLRLELDIRSGEDTRARLRFDLPIPVSRFWAETPYGALERGEELAHAINWVDLPEAGLALLNQGLSTHELAGNALYVSLFRGLSLLPDSGSCLKRDQLAPMVERGHREYNLALYPHAGDWREDAVVRAGLEFNNPLLALPIGTHTGTLPTRHSWFGVEGEGVVLDVVKEAEDGGALVLRLYESHGRPASARLNVPAGFGRWAESNLLEEKLGAVAPVGDGIVLRFRPFEIKTILLEREA